MHAENTAPSSEQRKVEPASLEAKPKDTFSALETPSGPAVKEVSGAVVFRTARRGWPGDTGAGVGRVGDAVGVAIGRDPVGGDEQPCGTDAAGLRPAVVRHPQRPGAVDRGQAREGGSEQRVGARGRRPAQGRRPVRPLRDGLQVAERRGHVPPGRRHGGKVREVVRTRQVGGAPGAERLVGTRAAEDHAARPARGDQRDGHVTDPRVRGCELHLDRHVGGPADQAGHREGHVPRRAFRRAA